MLMRVLDRKGRTGRLKGDASGAFETVTHSIKRRRPLRRTRSKDHAERQLIAEIIAMTEQECISLITRLFNSADVTMSGRWGKLPRPCERLARSARRLEPPLSCCLLGNQHQPSSTTSPSNSSIFIAPSLCSSTSHLSHSSFVSSLFCYKSGPSTHALLLNHGQSFFRKCCISLLHLSRASCDDQRSTLDQQRS